MPRISMFYGVVIYMYWNERDHPVAHFHAYHDGRRASISVGGEVLAGSLAPLNDPGYFAQVAVDRETGTIAWPGGVDLAPEPLYEQAKAHPLLAA